MRKICVVTSTRAEYGIMSRLIDLINQDKELELQLIVTGMHLSEKFGNTVDEITQPITKKIDIQIEKEPSHSFALAIEKFSHAFKELKPDMIVLLGDRYEILAVATSAMLNNIPIAHIHGGETTQGAIDEAIRHSITKMSHLHFTACEEYKKRVIQLGENPKRVFNVGSLGVENIKNMPIMGKEDLEKSLGFKFLKHNLLVTFHPVTLEGDSKEQFTELLSALDSLKDTSIIITAPNSDKGYEDIFALISRFEKTHKHAKCFESLGIKRYFAAIKYSDMVVGNSSSGILEAPSFKTPTINIGSRQQGRIHASSVINCAPKKEEILKAINQAYSRDFSNTVNFFEKENTAENIFTVLKTFDLNGILKKEFYDLK